MPRGWPTSTTCAGTCGSTPSWKAPAGTGGPSLASGAVRRRGAVRALSDHRYRVFWPAQNTRHPGDNDVRGQGHPHHRVGRRLRPGRQADRDHRDRRQGRAADSETRGRPPIPPFISAPRSRSPRRSTCSSRIEPNGSLPVYVDAADDPDDYRTIYELMITVGVVRYRVPLFRRLNISAMDLCKINRFGGFATKNCAASSPPTTTSGVSGRRYPTPISAAFTKPRVHLETNPSSGIEPDGIVTADGTRDRHRHPGARDGIQLVGGQLPGHRGGRPKRPQPRKVVAGDQVPGLPGRVHSLLPQLPEPGQSLRLLRTV